jgi:hypothetical protein
MQKWLVANSFRNLSSALQPNSGWKGLGLALGDKVQLRALSDFATYANEAQCGLQKWQGVANPSPDTAPEVERI